MRNKGIIYRVTHKQTGKVYIGATTKSLKERRLDHIQRAFRGEPGKLQKAIITYGYEAFAWTQIDTANSMDELAQKEKQYILKYNSKINGFNSDNGGGLRKRVHQFRLRDKKLIRSYNSLESAANAVNADKRSISKAALGVIRKTAGYAWSYSDFFSTKVVGDKRKKSVQQLSIEGNLISEFDSVTEASKQTNCNKTSIAKVCRGERKSSGGYYWKYD